MSPIDTPISANHRALALPIADARRAAWAPEKRPRTNMFASNSSARKDRARSWQHDLARSAPASTGRTGIRTGSIRVTPGLHRPRLSWTLPARLQRRQNRVAHAEALRGRRRLPTSATTATCCCRCRSMCPQTPCPARSHISRWSPKWLTSATRSAFPATRPFRSICRSPRTPIPARWPHRSPPPDRFNREKRRMEGPGTRLVGNAIDVEVRGADLGDGRGLDAFVEQPKLVANSPPGFSLRGAVPVLTFAKSEYFDAAPAASILSSRARARARLRVHARLVASDSNSTSP